MIIFQIFAVDVLHISSSLDIFGDETRTAHTVQHVFILCKE